MVGSFRSAESMSFTTTKRIEFRHTDAAGIAHFACFFGFMEEAEHAMLRELEIDLFTQDGDDVISWPRVSAHCDYRSTMRFGEVMDIEVIVRDMSEKTVTFGVVFTRDETTIAEGHLIAVCCRIRPGKPPLAIPIPEDMKAKLTTMMAD